MEPITSRHPESAGRSGKDGVAPAKPARSAVLAHHVGRHRAGFGLPFGCWAPLERATENRSQI